MGLKVGEAAERLRISQQRLYRWVRDGVLPPECVERIGINRRSIRIRSTALERYLRASNTAATKQ